MAQWLTNPMEPWGRGFGPCPCSVLSAVSCGVGCGRSSDPALLWLWCGPVAAALIRPLAWGPPCAAGAAQEDKREKKKKKKANIQCMLERPHMDVTSSFLMYKPE